MKKLLVAAVLVAIATGSLFAERLYLIQGTYLNTTRTYTGVNELKWNYDQAGINFTTFNGQGVGFYSSATFLMPFGFTEKLNDVDSGADIDDLTYLWDSFQLGLDALLGVGFLAPITPNFQVLVGGGLHFNGIALFSSWTDNYLAYNIGPGVAANALFYLSRSFNINVSAMAAWDVLEFLTMPDSMTNGIDASGGITWAISAGMGFKY